MFRPLRTLISLTLLAGMVWFSFAIELGDKTLAEHVDTISATPEAKQLLEGTRETVNPAIEDVRDRMLGEYVEAPTFIGSPDETVHASTLPPRSRERESRAVDEPALPGRRRVRAKPVDVEAEEAPPEPARPGFRMRPNVLVPVEVEVEEAAPAPAPEPAPPSPSVAIDLSYKPWLSHTDDRSFLAPWLELAASVPEAPEPTPIPIFEPVIEPELPELPGSR